jgi:tetratricopeptide (TPR) repeat protein
MTDNAPKGIWSNAFMPVPPHFGTSRDTELQALHQAVFAEQTPIVLLSGFAGVGKTALAAAYVKQYEACFKNIIWLNVLISIEEAVLRHCHRPNPKEILDSTIAPTLVAALYSEWNQADGRNLLILDDVNQVQQIQNLPHLSAQWTILCLSRLTQATAGMSIQKIGGLSPKFAQNLFLQSAPAAQAEITVLQKLLQSIDYHTFTIQFLAQNFQALRHSNPRYRLADWHQNLAHQQLLQLGKYAKIVDLDAATLAEKQAKIEDIVKFVYQLKLLTAIEKQYLTQIAFTMDTWFATESFALRLGMDSKLIQKWGREAQAALKILAQKGWLEVESVDNEHVVFKMNDLIQSIIIKAKSLEAPMLNQYLLNKTDEVMKAETLIWQQHLDLAHWAARLVEKFPSENLHKAKLNYFVGGFYLNARLLMDAKHFFKSYLKIGKALKSEHITKEAANRLVGIDILQDELNAAADTANPATTFQTALSFLKKAATYQERNAFKQTAPYLWKALQILESLCQTHPESLEYNQNLADAYLKASLFYSEQGDLEKTAFYLDKMVHLATPLAEKHAEVEAVQLLSATAHQNLGAVYQAQGIWEKAMDALQQSLDLLERMKQNKPQDARINNILILTYLKIGEIYFATGRMTDALTFFEKTKVASIQMLELDATHERFQQYLTLAHEKLGVTYQEMNDFAKALQHLEQRYALSTAYLQKKPASNTFKFGLALACEKLGALHQHQNRVKKAFEYFNEQLQWAEQLVQEAPQMSHYKHNLAVVHSKIGEIYQTQEDFALAFKHFEKYMRLCTQLNQNYPNTPDFQRSLAISYAKMGEMYFNEGDLQKSLHYFEKQQTLTEQLLADNPQPIHLVHGWAIACYHIGRIKKTQGDIQTARTLVEKAKTIWEGLFKQTAAAMYESNAKVMEQELASIHVRMPNMKELVAGMDKLK